MKWSRYSAVLEGGGLSNGLLYNSHSNTLLELDRESMAHVRELMKDPDAFDINRNPVLILQLRQGRFLLDPNEDPLAEIRYLAHSARFDSNRMGLTVAPTRDCNFNCTYCFEANRPPVYMDDETEDRLVEFIQTQGTKKLVDLTWYGGEPLLAFDRILNVSRRLRAFGTRFVAGIITNGYLLTPEKIEKLKECRVHHVQVTLDGDKMRHDVVRPHKANGASWDVVVGNVRALLEGWEGRVSIRVNVDKDNIARYPGYFRDLKELFPEERASVYPGIITQRERNSCATADSCMLSRKDTADFHVDAYTDHGIEDLKFYPDNGYFMCVMTHQNSFLVGPQGELYKCWDHLGEEKWVVGDLRRPGEVDLSLVSKMMSGVDPFADEKCSECFHLPRCYGGCPHFRYLNKYEGMEHDTCTMEKGRLKEFLAIHRDIQGKRPGG